MSAFQIIATRLPQDSPIRPVCDRVTVIARCRQCFAPYEIVIPKSNYTSELVPEAIEGSTRRFGHCDFHPPEITFEVDLKHMQ
jgi:hypothetical protein